MTNPTVRRTPLVGGLLAEGISFVGTWISMIAIPWFVLSTTGSATQTGLVAAAEITPLVLFKALGGPLLDRVGPRRVTLVCDLLSAFVVAAIPLLTASGCSASRRFSSSSPWPAPCAVRAIPGRRR